jgi:hypothetical protein
VRLGLLLTTLQVRVSIADRSSNDVESETLGLGRELDLGADVEEGKVTSGEVVGDTSSFVLQTVSIL